MTWARTFRLLLTDVLWKPWKWKAWCFAADYPPNASGPAGVVGQRVPVRREQVIRHVSFGVDGADRPLAGTLRYRRDDPYAVKFVFADAGEVIPWEFARELLHTAALERMPSGLADVCWHERDRLLVLDLSSPDGEATLTIPRAEVTAFLRDTYKVVPRGEESEHLAVDAVIDQIFRQEEWL